MKQIRLLLRRLFRFTLFGVLGLFLLLLTTVLVLNIPAVQTRLAQWGANKLSDQFGIRVSLEAARLTLPLTIKLSGIELYTASGDTVLLSEELAVVPGKFAKNHIRIRSIHLQKPYGKMLKHPDDSTNNWQQVIAAFAPEQPNPDMVFEIGAVSIENGFFHKYANQDSVAYAMENAFVDINGFTFANGGVDAFLHRITFDGMRLDLEEMSGAFIYRKNQGVGFSRAVVRTNKSSVRGDFFLNVNDNADYSAFAEKVALNLRFDQLDFYSEELRAFVKVFPELGHLVLKGEVQGTLESLRAKDLRVQYESATSLRGDLHLQYLASKRPLIMDVQLNYMRSNHQEFSKLLTILANENLAFAEPYINTFAFSGRFAGTRDVFNASGTLHTDVGTFEMGLQLDAEGKALVDADFSGKVNGKKVNAGRLLAVDGLGNTDFTFDVMGNGLSPNNATLNLRGKATSVRYRQYNIKNVSVDGRMESLFFDGEIGVNDPNLAMHFDGTAILKPGEIQLNFLSSVNHANLIALGVTDVDSLYNLQADAVVNVAQTDNWVGEVQIQNAFVERSHRVYFFRDINVASFELGNKNILSVNADFLNARVEGRFQIPQIYQILHGVVSQQSSYVDPFAVPDDVYFTAQVNTGDTRLITDLFLPQLEVFRNAELAIAIDSKRIDLSAMFPGVRFNGYEARRLNMQVNGKLDEKIPLQARIEELISDNWNWKDLVMSADFFSDSLQFDIASGFDQGGGGHIQLLGLASQTDASDFVVALQPSQWKIAGGDVRIEPNNTIVIQDGAIRVDNLSLTSDGRRMLVNGNVSASPYEILRVQLERFSVDAFNVFLEPKGFVINGVLEGEMIFNSLLGEPRFASDLRIDSLYVNEYWQGDFFLDSEWYINEQFVELDVHLDRGNLRTLEVSGNYFPDRDTAKFEALVTARRFRIRPLTPLFTAFTDDLRGVASGQIALRGTPKTPELDGVLTVPNLGLTIPFLNTRYNLEGSPEVVFKPNQIFIPNARVVDTDENTSGQVRADLRHNFFKDWQIDVHIDADRFLALNTNAALNDYFYGKVFVSGDVDITGPTKELQFNIDVKTHRGTEFYIPVDGPTDVNPMGFVDFVKVDAEKEVIEEAARGAVLNLQINIDVTPDAEVYLIMDQRTGETIRGNGRGRLRFNLDPEGNAGLFGSLEINRGEYLFTLGGLVRKRFFIEPGGSITFNGDPYEALLDLSTKYVTRTSLSGAVADPTLAAVRTEVNLFLNLSGLLSNPEISFDIKLPNVAPGIQAEVNDRFADPNRLTQQAFSLLALNSFYTDDLALDAQVQGGLASTTIDVFAGQVNNFLSQYIKVVDIAVNYTGEGVTGASQEEFEVAVSRRLFDDRISINGVVGVPLGANQNQLAGDVEIEMMLTQDGRVRAKAFNRSYQNNLLIEQTGLYSQGVGLFYRTDFNRRRELLRRLLFID